VFKERAKVGVEEVEVDKKQWRGSDEARRATGCICIVSGMEDSRRRAEVPSYHVVWAWAVCGVDEGQRAVESGQVVCVGSWWGRIQYMRRGTGVWAWL
jgi:hypothetical protein